MTLVEGFIQSHFGRVVDFGTSKSSAAKCVACSGRIHAGCAYVKIEYTDSSGIRTARAHAHGCSALERAAGFSQ
jgi:hypothetical protein